MKRLDDKILEAMIDGQIQGFAFLSDALLDLADCRAALRTYGQHFQTCECRRPEESPSVGACTCGFMEALGLPTFPVSKEFKPRR